ncbi:MAG: hypothetical protein A2271_04700 [Candidatus Moranbacteria bacterium RIFOXYA12_FULL_35_19]|nr:MAG: hypothetical protein UR78_C0001G0066 [Candidatus Moranbacteria bacterium GW2011_GWF2_35_39]OGI32031.1 MAG: hypothetical protein A2343_02460 [Candidatus Moranbacteria bacterium RIFOXYB12_FULL_35_8]OGI35738.1 MAG: hypothetical protein A2271_04700 [Candidatus Moranbacteria bacterium RIFOXYA12_FULL_35_19]
MTNIRKMVGLALTGLVFLVFIFSLPSILILGENFFIADPIGLDEITEWLRLPYPRTVTILVYCLFFLLGAKLARKQEIKKIKNQKMERR